MNWVKPQYKLYTEKYQLDLIPLFLIIRLVQFISMDFLLRFNTKCNVTLLLIQNQYFLDIDKIQKFPITFVIKSEECIEGLLSKLKANANKIYLVTAIVDKYMACIEEVINIPILNGRFSDTIKLGYLNNILNEIITQSKVEFNYTEIEELEEETD